MCRSIIFFTIRIANMSYAATACRKFGKPCITGLIHLQTLCLYSIFKGLGYSGFWIDREKNALCNQTSLTEQGDVITINGGTGKISLGFYDGNDDEDIIARSSSDAGQKYRLNHNTASLSKVDIVTTSIMESPVLNENFRIILNWAQSYSRFRQLFFLKLFCMKLKLSLEQRYGEKFLTSMMCMLLQYINLMVTTY